MTIASWAGRCTGCGREHVEVAPRHTHGERVLCARCAVKPDRVAINGAKPNGRRVVLTAASAITPKRLRWLWQQRLPLCALSLLAGEPGLGKSTTTTELAALVTRGKLEGELQGTPHDVLVATAEDHFASVVWGRLSAADADMDRVHRVHIEDRDGEGLLSIPEDIATLEQHCVGLAAQGRPVALVTVDPVSAFISAGIDSHRDAAVRRVLAPLAGLAERQNLAVLGVAHLNKDTTGKLLNRVGGSVAFGAAPRSVLAFARDPDDPEGEQGRQRVIVHAKTNNGRYAPTLAARIESRDVPEVGNMSRLVITGECDIGPNDLQRGRDEDGPDYEEAIGAALAAGPRPGREVKKTVCRELGCSPSTVDRAARRMRERAELTIEKKGFPPTTTWLHVRVTPADVRGGDFGDVNDEFGSAEPNLGASRLVRVMSPMGDVNGVDAPDDGLDDVVGLEQPIDTLTDALRPPGCRCERPLAAPTKDGELRCTRCGHRTGGWSR